MTNAFEEKNILKAIIQMAIPAMLAQMTTLIYNIADTYFVSTTKDPAAIAAVSLCTPFLLIIMSVSSVFGMGGNSVIARLLGENKREEARKVFNFCSYALIISGTVTLIIGIFFTAQIADLLGADDINRGFTIDYLRGIFIGSVFIIYANGIVNIFRSVLMIRQSTIGIALGNGINIFLDYLFISVLKMGTFGAALATSIGFTAASIYYVICIFKQIRRKNDILSVSIKEFKPDRKIFKSIVSIGIPGALVTILMSTANIVLNNYIAIYGSDEVAEYGIAYKIDTVPIMLSVGLALGVAPLIGYSYGAGDHPRVHKTVFMSCIFGVSVGAVFTFAFLAFADPLSSVFLDDIALISKTAYMLRVLSISAPMLGIINVISFYYQALGNGFKSLTITLLRNIVIFIPCVVLSNAIFRLNGVVAAQPITETVLALICAAMYYTEYKRRSPSETLTTSEQVRESHAPSASSSAV